VDKGIELIATVKLLHDAGVRFILVGGLALIAHGGHHTTYDIDVSPVPDSENHDALIAFLKNHHARPLGIPPSQNFQILPRHLQIGKLRFLNLKTDLGDIDILPLPAGIDSFEGFWERSVELDLGGFIVRVASLEDLAAMKRAAGRTKDLLHLIEIEALIRLRDTEGLSAG
jgi:hypothetical protein